MGDESDDMRARRRAQEAREYSEYQSPHAQLQRQMDYAWTLELARRAERAWRRSRPDVREWCGEYSPIAQFEEETRGSRSW
jgi:hypothetical protein